MGFLYRAHYCNEPNRDQSRVGDVWQCDECKRIFMRTIFAWMPAYQDVHEKWRLDNPLTRQDFPAKEKK